MSRVYLGERDDLKQKAAVKLLTGEFRDPAMLARFRAEQRALASLQHPNIVQLIDGGIDVRGTLFLIMDYVEGVELDAFCNTRQLSISNRIELMARILDALE